MGGGGDRLGLCCLFAGGGFVQSCSFVCLGFIFFTSNKSFDY